MSRIFLRYGTPRIAKRTSSSSFSSMRNDSKTFHVKARVNHSYADHTQSLNLQQSNIGGLVLGSAVALGIGTALVVALFGDGGEGSIRDADGNSQSTLATEEFRTVSLVKSKALTHDTKLLRFQLPSDYALEYSTPSKLIFRTITFDVDECYPFGKQVERPYTIVSLPDQKGHFDLIVKKYASPEGDMSRFLHNLQPHQTVQVRGPIRCNPVENDNWTIRPNVGMVAGGTGVTSMLQIIRVALSRNTHERSIRESIVAELSEATHKVSALFHHESETTTDGTLAAAAKSGSSELTSHIAKDERSWVMKTLSLVVSDKTIADAILYRELEEYHQAHPDELKVYRTLTRRSPHWWGQGTGRVSREQLEHRLPSPGPATVIFVSGPRGFVDHVAGSGHRNITKGEMGPVGGLLGSLGYTRDMVRVLDE